MMCRAYRRNYDGARETKWRVCAFHRGCLCVSPGPYDRLMGGVPYLHFGKSVEGLKPGRSQVNVGTIGTEIFESTRKIYTSLEGAKDE